MFEQSMSASIGDLDEVERKLLLKVVEARYRFMHARLSVDGLRMMALQDPTPENIKAYEDLDFVANSTGRTDMVDALGELFRVAVDKKKLQDILPMVGSAVLQAVNLPLLLQVFNTDERELRMILDKVNEFLRSGMD